MTKFYFLEPEPLIKALIKMKPVKVQLGSWKGLTIIGIGPRNGKIVGYRSDGKPIYAGSHAAEQLALIQKQKHTYTPAQQDVELVKWLQALGLQGAVDAEQVHLSKEGATLLQTAFGVTPAALGGGKWGIGKALLLPHLGEPLKPTEEHITGWAAQMAAGDQDEVFPPLHTLKEIPAGKFVGSHNNQLFLDKSGKKWVFKPADPTIARAEEAASRIGRLLLGDRIPAAKYVDVKGKGGVLIQVLDGEVWQESSSQHSDPQLSYLKKYAEQVVQHEVVDWLISNHDSHAGNFLADGEKLVAIDKGQAWKWIGNDVLDPAYKGSNPSYQIYNKFWESVKQGKIGSVGLVEAVAEIVNRAEKISPEQFALLVAPYVSTWAGGKDADPHERLQKMVSRLTNLRGDFEQFLSSQLQKPITLPKPSAVQVNWETPPVQPLGEEKGKVKQEEKPQPVQLTTPASESQPILQEVEHTPVLSAKPAAGWPLTKKGAKTVQVTVHHPGQVPPTNWPVGTPGPAMHLTCGYKGAQYSLMVGEDMAAKKPIFTVTYPNGDKADFSSLNAAGDSLYLYNKGLPLNLTATEKKKQGISLGSKVFQLKLFEQELAEAYGKKDEPVPVAVATPEQLEEQKVIEPEQKQATAFQLLTTAQPAGTVLSMYDPALPQEIKEFTLAHSGKNQLSGDWDLALTPGQVVIGKHDFFGGPVIFAARLSKEGKPELWGWWEGVEGAPQSGQWTGATAKVFLESLGLKNNPALAQAKKEYEQAVQFEASHSDPIGSPPEVVLPESATVPETAPKFTAGPLAAGTTIKVKKKVPGYDKKQEVVLTALQNGKLLVEIPGQTAQTFDTLSAASDHVWVVQKGYTDAADYKAQNKTNKVPSGGGWKFWGVSPTTATVGAGDQLGAGAVAAPSVAGNDLPAVGAPAEVPAPAGVTAPAEAKEQGKVPFDAALGEKDSQGWQALKTATTPVIDALPAGTVLSWPSHWQQGNHQAKKEADGSWDFIAAPNPQMGPFGKQSLYQLMAYVSLSVGAGHQPKVKLPNEGGPEAASAAPVPENSKTDQQVALVDEIKATVKLPKLAGFAKTVQLLKDLPTGIVLKTKSGLGTQYAYAKQADGTWSVSGGLTTVSNFAIDALAADLCSENEIIVGFTPASEVAPIVPTSEKFPTDVVAFSQLPVGTFVQTKANWGAITKCVKKADNKWEVTLESGESVTYSDIDAFNLISAEKLDTWNPKGEVLFAPEQAPESGASNWPWFELHPTEAADKVKPDIEVGGKEFDKLPAGTKLQFVKDKGPNALLHTAVKNDEGKWDFKFAQGIKETYSNATAKIALGHLNVGIKQLVGPGKDFIEDAAPKLQEPSIPPGLIAQDVATLPLNIENFVGLPVGTVVTTISNVGSGWTYTKTDTDTWQAQKGGTENIFSGMMSATVLGDLKDEHILTYAIPSVADIPAPIKPAQKLDSIVSYVDLPAAAKDAMTTVMVNILKLHKNDPTKLQKPSNWPAWVPPTALILKGVIDGKEFYVFNSAMAKNNDGSPATQFRFSVVLPDGTFYTGVPDEKPIMALGSAMQQAGITASGIDAKEALGLYGVSFPTGATEADPFLEKASPAIGALKPVEQMTPVEKTAKVKTNMPLKQALKMHPGLQAGTLKVKKAKGDAMYICLDGVEGASTKLYEALQDLGVAHAIKNVGGMPKVNAKGAFVTVDNWVLDQEVTVETTALAASSAQHAPSDPNWQTMPKAKTKKQTKKQIQAAKEAQQKMAEAKAKAGQIKVWGEQHPPVSDAADLQLLAYVQKGFDLFGIPYGAIARAGDGKIFLGHKTHYEQLKKYLTQLDAGKGAVVPVKTPLGEMLSVDLVQLKPALESFSGLPIGGVIKGPDGKEYPAGTTFQKKVVETTVAQLLPGEPGFYKIMDHKAEPNVLGLIKISGTGAEQIAQMKAMIEKYGLEGPFPAPKASENSIIHSVYKKSLQKIWKTEEVHTPTIPEQPAAFVAGSLPYSEPAKVWEEVGDGSGDLANIAAVKPALFGTVLRIGAPGQLRDFSIRYRKVKDPNGKLYYEFTGDLVTFNGLGTGLQSGTVKYASTQNKPMSGMGEKSVKVMDYDPATGVHTEASEIGDGPDPKGFFGTTEAGSSISVVPPSSDQDTLKNTFRVRIPMELDPVAELRAAFQKMGKDPDLVLASINEDSDRIFKKSMYVRGLMGASGWNEGQFTPELMHNEEWLDAQLAKFGAKTKAQNLKVVKTFDNQVSVVADDVEKFAEWNFAYVGSKSFGTTLQLLQGSGWSSRRNRLLHGVWNGGQSAGADFQNGGAKGTFFRIAGPGKAMLSSYECQIIVHPRVFQRTDWWRYNQDGYGNTSSYNQHGAPVAKSPKRYTGELSTTNEIIFEGGVSAQDIVAVVVNDDTQRADMIAKLQAAGITELNGKPLNEVIIPEVYKGANAYGNSDAFAKVLGIKKGE
jgi:hypothetical protein